MKIFIADDSKIVRERLTTLLSELKDVEVIGYAGDVPDSIDAIRRLEPEVVVLDIRMPGGSGIDVLEQIKKKSNSPVFIVLTNYPYPAYRKKCMEAGADFFLCKSTQFDQVSEIIRSLQQPPPCNSPRLPDSGPHGRMDWQLFPGRIN